MDNEKKATFMVLVTGRKNKEALLSALNETGIKFIEVIYGRGAVSAGVLKNMFGLITEENKVVVLCVTTLAKSEAVYKLLVEKFNFDKPNTGMAFSVPLESVLY